VRAFQICIHFSCAIIGAWVSYTENLGYTLQNSKCAERVVILAIRRKKIGLFKYVSTFTVRSLGVWFTDSELKTIKAFQWIPLPKIYVHEYLSWSQPYCSFFERWHETRTFKSVKSRKWMCKFVAMIVVSNRTWTVNLTSGFEKRKRKIPKTLKLEDVV